MHAMNESHILQTASPRPHVPALCRSFFTQIANHPNPRPPQVLPQSPRGLCHLMSPSLLQDLRERRAPDPSRARQQAVPENPDPQSNSTPTADPISTAASAFSWTLSNAPRATPPPLKISTFRLFDVSTFPPRKPPKSRTTRTNARHKCCHSPHKACVTLCHLRFCKTCARSKPLSSHWTPGPLGPLAPFFSPYVTYDLEPGRYADVSSEKFLDGSAL